MAFKSNGAKSLGGPIRVDGIDPRGPLKQREGSPKPKPTQSVETQTPPSPNTEPGTQ